MAMSDAYWAATKPNGMPDSVWNELQAKKKAEEEAKKKAEEVAKKLAEDAAKKKAEEANKVLNAAANGAPVSTEALINAMINSSGSGTIPSTQDKINNFAAATIESNRALQEAARIPSDSSNTGAQNGGGSNNADTSVKKTGEYSEDYYNKTKPNYMPDEEWDKLQEEKAEEEAKKDKTYPVNSYSPETGYVPNYAPTSTSTTNTSSNSSNNVSVTNTPTQSTTYVTTPTAEEVAKYVSSILNSAKEQLGTVEAPTYETAEKPGAVTLRSLEDLANTFGIEYDYDKLYGIFNDSVEAQYDAIYAKQRQNENAYYDNAAAAQNTLLDTLSRDRGNAVQAGVSKGMQAANALGAMLGVSQQFANNATTLSQERSNTAKDYGADLAKAKIDAEATSNERKNAIMEIAKMLYGYDSEQYVANMDNYNTILTNNAALQQTYMNNQSALQNALASIFGSVVSNKITGDSNLQSSTLAAEAQKLAAQYAAEAQKYAADKTLAGNQAIANANKAAADASAEAQKWIAQLQAGLLENNEVAQTGGTDSTSDTGASTSNSYRDYGTVTLPDSVTYYPSAEQNSATHKNLATVYAQNGNATMSKVYEILSALDNASAYVQKGVQSDVDSVTWVLQDMWYNLLDSFGIKH
jgi:hypothetical protein